MKPLMLPAEFASALLAWYDAHARALPWRSQPTPYRVWVSEIMLQQTRVEAVKPYFERFVAALPDVTALAVAPEAQLLKLWEGLGYYRRVRYLQLAAREIAGQYDGVFPATAAELEKLPGIGAYTAAAIASIAFGEAVPAVDGNVLRVIARVGDDAREVTRQAVKKEFTEALRVRIPAGRAGDFTQSVMELGATVCLPNGAPLCGDCPLRTMCAGRKSGRCADLPMKASAKPRRVEDRTVFLLRCGEKVAVVRRPESGLLGGLWEFSHREWGQAGAAPVLPEAWTGAVPVRNLGSYTHVFSHLEWRLTVWEFHCEREFEDVVWVPIDRLAAEVALPSVWKPVTAYLTGKKTGGKITLGR